MPKRLAGGPAASGPDGDRPSTTVVATHRIDAKQHHWLDASGCALDNFVSSVEMLGGVLTAKTPRMIMKTKMLWTAAAAMMLAVAAGPAAADDPTPDPKMPVVKVTPAEKAAARAKRKADVVEARKKGEVASGGEASPSPAYKASGTHATRKAARQVKRKEIAAAEKKGEVPHPNEASDPTKK